MLLQIESSSYVLNFFMEVRKSALKSLVEKSQESVRIQVSSMVQCLISTILLLHDCFICQYVVPLRPNLISFVYIF